MNEVDKSTSLGFQALNFATDTANILSNVFLQSLRLASERDPAARLLFKELHGNKNLDIVYCSKEDSKILAERIKDQGIPCVAGSHNIRDRLTKSVSEKSFVIFPENELEHVRGVINNFRYEQNYGAISTEELIYTGSAIKCINDLDYNQAKLYMEHAERLGIGINMKPITEDKYNVYYAEKDAIALDSIKRTVSIELSGKAGESLAKQLAYENDNYNRITSRVLTDKEDFEVTDLENRRLSVNYSGATFYDKGNTVHLDRNSQTFNDDICKVISTMKNPVDLTLLDFQQQQYYDKGKKKEFLYTKDKEHGRPELTKEEYDAVKRMIDRHQLYEQKISLENPVQQLYEYSYTNNEMRMATFENYEEMNKTDIKEDIIEEEKSFNEEDKALFDEADSSYKDIKEVYIEPDSLRTQDEMDEFFRETDMDKNIFDLDMNGIDDRYEEIELED